MNDYAQTHIRPARMEDVVAVHELIHRTIDVCYSGVYPPRAVAFFKQHNSRRNVQDRHAKGYMLVVERSGSIVATGTLMDGRILGVYVRPDLQRTGCGRLIMENLEAKAASEGNHTVGLDVSLTSRDFYEKLGYAIIESCSLDAGGGQRLDYWKAVRNL